MKKTSKKASKADEEVLTKKEVADEEAEELEDVLERKEADEDIK